ncbi:hypothetical protein RND71_035586 [Anisodus tanguticus]|uniref:Uncharacterized protein n=1 Tax=Anisodus tanguticus TaxID=243964 RepID=A0AAE1R4S0_9SOLA|nr:hypothetical protein RND71_035586 [Anisodus tanguticus]
MMLVPIPSSLSNQATPEMEHNTQQAQSQPPQPQLRSSFFHSFKNPPPEQDTFPPRNEQFLLAAEPVYYSNLKPVTRAEVYHYMFNWLINWDQKLHGVDEFDSAKYWKPDKALIEWLHSCLDMDNYGIAVVSPKPMD